jgi:T5SS/PEP-CTERM-associated repeat protein
MGGKTRRRLATALLLGCCWAVAHGEAQAAVIVSGGNCGTGTLASSGTTSSQLIVGCVANGTLTVDSTLGQTTATAGYTGGSIGLVAGYFGSPQGVGTIAVNGNGSSGSATLNVTRGIELGVSGGDGSLNLTAGGVAQVTSSGYDVTVANSGSSGSLSVTGVGSKLLSGQDIYVGAFTGATGSLTVQNGGLAQTGTTGINSGALIAGAAGGTNATVTVSGAGSTLNTHGLILGDGFDAGSNVTFTVSNGGVVNVSTVAGAGSGFGVGASGTGIVTVTGAGSQLNIAPVTSGIIAGKEVVIGGYGNGTLLVTQSATVNAAGANVVVSGGVFGTQTASPGLLTVRNGASLTANSVTVNSNGTLNGDGTIHADVTMNGGTISPGNSPGTLTINGDLNASSGVFNFELASATVVDHINVSGNLTIGSDTTFNLVFDYAPPGGQVFDVSDFFTAGGLFSYDPDFDLASQLRVLGLQSGDEIVVTADGQRLTVGSAVPVPEPGSSLVFLAGLALLAGIAGRRSFRFAAGRAG